MELRLAPQRTIKTNRHMYGFKENVIPCLSVCTVH